MKATYNGVSMEGTPREIYELKRLMDEQVKPPGTVTKYVHYTPWYRPWCSATTASTAYTNFTTEHL